MVIFAIILMVIVKWMIVLYLDMIAHIKRPLIVTSYHCHHHYDEVDDHTIDLDLLMVISFEDLV